MYELLTSIELTGQYAEHYLVYTRKSMDDADSQKNSIAYQTQKSIAYAKEHHIPIAPFTHEGFCNNGVITEHHSGFKEKINFEILEDASVKQSVDRPKFLKLVELLQQKQFKGIIVNCWDRISRNDTDGNLIKKLRKQGTDIRFVDTTYDNSSAGELHMDIDGIFSRHYSRTISEKVRNAATKLRKEGKCLYSAPLGYLDQGSDNKPHDPERAHIIKRIFERYAEGGWSYATLAKWANTQGLTTRPRRRKRTKDEMLTNVDINTIPKICHPISSKHIENILKNPFYIGINVHNKETDTSTAHEPIISEELFYQVQRMIKHRTTIIHNEKIPHFAYRGLVQCAECSRIYSPYVKKGITYYSCRCKKGCTNTKKTIAEKDIDTFLQDIIDSIYFSEEELMRIETIAQKELVRVTNRRNKALEDLRNKQNKVLADLDYLISERISLIRTGVMSLEYVKDEEHRLKEAIADIEIKMSAYNESTKKMLDYVITFSNLIKHTLNDFKDFHKDEKNEIVQSIFSELYLNNGILEYKAKQGFDALLTRFTPLNRNSGSPNYLFSELESIYSKVKVSHKILKEVHHK